LAERLVEIVSADSRLFYRGMDVTPSIHGGQARVRTAIDEQTRTRLGAGEVPGGCPESIVGIHARGIALVGGTGQYIRATEGWLPPRVSPDERFVRSLSNWRRRRPCFVTRKGAVDRRSRDD
jgi:tRNA A37 N6-isopentenylltransferase MiaA